MLVLYQNGLEAPNGIVCWAGTTTLGEGKILLIK